jgi:hypothetical protein
VSQLSSGVLHSVLPFVARPGRVVHVVFTRQLAFEELQRSGEQQRARVNQTTKLRGARDLTLPH